jgi:hypothetical protein
VVHRQGYCCASEACPPARRLAGVISNVAGAMVLVALIVLLMLEALARVPIVCCYCDAVTLAALTTLLAEDCSAQTGHLVPWCTDKATAAPVRLVLLLGGLPASSARWLVQWFS